MTAHPSFTPSDPTTASASSLPSTTPPPGPGSSSPVAIRLRGLTRVYEVPGRQDARVTALDHVDADLPEGSFTAVVGASGSGKSTLLHCVAGLDEPTDGQVTMLGALTSGMRAAERARFRARHVGFVFQEYNLIASLSAADNVSMPSRLAGRPLSDAQTRAALDAVGLAHRAGLKPHQLSGGERQRVAIARAFLKDAPVLLLDEATSALDGANEAAVTRAMEELSAGRTVVVIAHRLSTIRRADRIVVLVDGAVGRVGGEFEGVGHEPEGVHGQAQQRRVGGAVGQGGVDVGAQIEQDRSALGNLAAMAGASPVQALAHLLQGGRGEDIAHEGILGRVQRPPGIGRVTAGGCVRTRHPRPSPISRFDFAPPVMPRGPHPGRHATPPPPDLRNTP